MGFEYMFFDEALRDRFVDFAAARGIASTVRKDVIAGFVVELPDGLADALQEALEAEYDTIMEEQMLLAESDEELVSHHVAGVTVTLADGARGSRRTPGNANLSSTKTLSKELGARSIEHRAKSREQEKTTTNSKHPTRSAVKA